VTTPARVRELTQRERIVQTLASRVHAPTHAEACAIIERRAAWAQFDRGMIALANGRKRSIPPVE
jgi:hypothetical protein